MSLTLTEAEMRKKLRAEFPEHFKHAWTLYEMAQEALGSFQAITDTPFKRSIVLLGGRSFKAYHAILNLCEIAYTEDAAVILRSLFQLLVIMRWLSVGDSEAKSAKYLGWFWVGLEDELKQHRARISSHLSGMVTRNYATHKGMFQYTGPDGTPKMRKKWYEPEVGSLEQMADAVGLRVHYDGLYRPLSSIEHSDALAYFSMVSDISVEGGEVKLSLHSDLFVPAHLRNAFQCFGEIFHTWNQMFALRKEDHVRRVCTEGIDFFKQDMSERLPSEPHGIT